MVDQRPVTAVHQETFEVRRHASEGSYSGVSWPAVAAGAVVCSALTLLVLAFGAGLGFSVVSPWSNAGASTTTFHVAAGLYLIVVAMLSSSIGGYLAGRLRTKWVDVHNDEVYFRDTAHGFLAWAFATIISAALLASAASSVVGGAASSLASEATANRAGVGGPTAYFVDTLLRRDPSNAATGNPADQTARGEVARLLATNLSNDGDIAAPDRAYLAQVVTARTGLSPADADKRVSDVIIQAKAAADKARRAAAALSIWLAASMLIGAFAASLAAIEGGQLRDRAHLA